MDTLRSGYTGIALIARLNRDRVFALLTVLGALYVGAWIGSAI
jgi:hypothetical protein